MEAQLCYTHGIHLAVCDCMYKPKNPATDPDDDNQNTGAEEVKEYDQVSEDEEDVSTETAPDQDNQKFNDDTPDIVEDADDIMELNDDVDRLVKLVRSEVKRFRWPKRNEILH